MSNSESASHWLQNKSKLFTQNEQQRTTGHDFSVTGVIIFIFDVKWNFKITQNPETTQLTPDEMCNLYSTTTIRKWMSHFEIF